MVPEWEEKALALGIAGGEYVASWLFDGNTPEDVINAVGQFVTDGDPRLYNLVRLPDLSGEFADERTPRDLYEEVTGRDAHADASWDIDTYHALCDALCDAYELGVSSGFENEIMRVAEVSR